MSTSNAPKPISSVRPVKAPTSAANKANNEDCTAKMRTCPERLPRMAIRNAVIIVKNESKFTRRENSSKCTISLRSPHKKEREQRQQRERHRGA